MDEAGGSLVVLRDVGDTKSRYHIEIQSWYRYFRLDFRSVDKSRPQCGVLVVYRTSLTGENIAVAEMEIIRAINWKNRGIYIKKLCRLI